MSFYQETYTDSVLTEEKFQFLLPAAYTIAFQAGQPQSFRHVHPSRPTAIFGYKADNDFEDDPRAGRA
jgi:hypothetical protein